MENARQIDELCAAVAELAGHVRKIALGMQGLKINQQLDALIDRVEEIRTSVSP